MRLQHLGDDIDGAADILRLLRPHPSDALFHLRLSAAIENGYRIILARDDGEPVGCLGYRISFDIFWGKSFYVDDLIVRPDARGKGLGGLLLEEAKSCASRLKCDHIRLCSGMDRVDAHRFYERHGLERKSLQFAYSLQQKEE